MKTGSPTIFLAILAAFVLPASPQACRFLNPRERAILASRVVKARGQDSDRRLNKKQVLAAFFDYKNYLSSLIIFCVNVSLVCYYQAKRLTENTTTDNLQRSTGLSPIGGQ